MKHRIIWSFTALMLAFLMAFMVVSCNVNDPTGGNNDDDKTCTIHIDANHDGKCDNPECDVDGITVVHKDTDHDGICDTAICGKTGLAVTHDSIVDDGDCTTAVKCSCGHTLVVAKTHDFSGAYESDGAGHFHVCQNEGCNIADTKENHVDDNDDLLCDQCNATVPRNNCGNHIDANHDGACDNTGCDVVGMTIVHTDANHDGTCDAAACGKTGLAITHDKMVDDGDCTTAVTCACGHTLVAAKTHDFTGDWETDATHHWHTCANDACNAEDTKTKHYDGNSDGRCDNCYYVITAFCIHVDENKDDKCDICSVSVIINVDLFAVNDLHGKFLPNDLQPGVGGLTTYLDNAKTENPNTVIFSSGDMWQGSAESGLSKGKIMNDWMKELGFAFMTIGNHEFDWGSDYIQANSSDELPFLGINVYEKSTNQRAEYAESSVMVDFGELQIGFIGAMGDNIGSISGEFTGDLMFITGDALTDLIMAESEWLRSEGADIVILSIHAGGSQAMASEYDTALSNGYIDVVFEAHSHSAYELQDEYGVWHLQAGGDNTAGIFNVEIDYNFLTKNFDISPSLVAVSEYGACEEHASIEKIENMNRAALDKTTEVVGTNSTLRNSTFLKALVAELYAEGGLEKWGDTYNIVLGGGSINCRSPYELPAGEVTYGDLYMLFPFDNALALCEISGSKLQERYFNNSAYTMCYTPYGNTVKGNVNTNTIYYIIADSYNYTYAANGLTMIEAYVDYETTSVYARDLLTAYIKAGGLETAVAPELQANGYNSIKDLNAYGEYIGAGSQSTDKFFTYGEIIAITGEIYGNMYIQDANGDQLYIYGLYDISGNRYDAMTDKPQVGDTIYVYGIMKNHQGIVEMDKAVYVDYKFGNTYYTIEELNNYGQSLVDNQTTIEWFYTVGTIESIASTTYGNLYLKDDAGNSIYLYGLYDHRGNRYDSLENPPQAGDKIYVYGALKKYVKNGEVTIELVNSVYAPYLESGEYTAQELEAHGLTLIDNQTTLAVFSITGTVQSLTNTEHGVFYLEDENGGLIYVYKVYDQYGNSFDAMPTQPKEGDTVTICGSIKKYVNYANEVTIEFYGATCTVVSEGAHTHTETAYEDVAPTCTENGYTGGIYCSECGAVLVARTVVPAEHLLEDVAAVPPTMSNGVVTDGYTAYLACTRCDYTEGREVVTFRETSITDALSVSIGTYVKISGKVTQIYNPWNETYQNISVYIEDATGNRILLYQLATKVVIGDIITAYGQITDYRGTNQVAKGATATIDGHEDYEIAYNKMTVAGALAAADGTNVEVTGTVVEIGTAWSDTYGNITVTIRDEAGDELLIYRLSTKVELGDVIIVRGTMGTHGEIREILQGATAEFVEE